MSARINRRTFIFGGLGLIATGSTLYNFTNTTSLKTPDISNSFFVPPSCALVKIGQKHLSNTTPAPTIASLTNTLKPRLNLPLHCEDKSLGDTLRSDYAAHRHVELAGWILPETAAQISALFVLNRNNERMERP